MLRLRIATYNIHKCQGLDGRVRPERILTVLRQLDADIIALQEVLCLPQDVCGDDPAQYFAKELGYHCQLGENRQLRGGPYGNVTLSRWAFGFTRNYDLTVAGREPRGCLRTDVMHTGETLHIFNVHLGTAFLERRHQGRKLLDHGILTHPGLCGPRVLLGDFNEWTRGLATRLLSAHLESADIKAHLGRRRTYPGVLPFLHLDHIYHDAQLCVERLRLHRTPLSLIASDHLPLVADIVAAK